jgi:membrane fusion protein, multidrug efflux system
MRLLSDLELPAFFSLHPIRRRRLPGVARKTALLSIVLLLPAVLMLDGCGMSDGSGRLPPGVKVVQVSAQKVPIYRDWVAQLNGPVNADITPKVQGSLLRRDYTEGFFVKKGQLLYEIDPRPFQAALDQAKAHFAIAVARQNEAANSVARDRRLSSTKHSDTDLASLASATTQLDTAKTALDQAMLNLASTRIYAPIAGVAGFSNANVGEMVSVTTKMTTISQVDPIRASFNVSEAEYPESAHTARQTTTATAQNSAAQQVEFIQADGDPYPAKGSLAVMNRQSSSSGTIELAADFPNKDGMLRPGGFGNVRIASGGYTNAVLVPQTAVLEAQSSYEVATLDGNRVRLRPVKLGERVGQDWIVTEGLRAGDRVVVDGFDKLPQTASANVQPYLASTAMASIH